MLDSYFFPLSCSFPSITSAYWRRLPTNLYSGGKTWLEADEQMAQADESLSLLSIAGIFFNFLKHNADQFQSG